MKENKHLHKDIKIGLTILLTLISAGVFYLLITILPSKMRLYEENLPLNFQLLAKDYIEKGQFKKAEKSFDDAEKAFKKDIVDKENLTKLYLFKSSYYQSRKEYEKAISSLKDLILLNASTMSLNSFFPEIYVRLAACYLSLNDFQNANLSFKIAYDLDNSLKTKIIGILSEQVKNTKGNRELILETCDFLSYAGDYKDALSILDKLRSTNPEKIRIMGEIYYKQKSYDKAETYFEEHIQLVPDSLREYYYLENIYKILKENNKISILNTNKRKIFKEINTYNTLSFSTGRPDKDSWTIKKEGYFERKFTLEEMKKGKLWLIAKGDLLMNLGPNFLLEIYDSKGSKLNPSEFEQIYINSTEFIPYEVDLNDLIKKYNIKDQITLRFFYFNNTYSDYIFESRKPYVQSLYLKN